MARYRKGLLSRIYRSMWVTLLRRLIVSAILVLPFLAAGVYGLTIGDFPPTWASVMILALGATLMLTGLYMSFGVMFPTPALVASEKELVVRHPTMKPALARMIMSLPCCLFAGFLFVFTAVPYVYPFALMVGAMVLFYRGAARYWVNLHITYTVTDRRVIHMYRFMWLHTTEIPVSRIISISEARSFFEIITGRGSVAVASGIGRNQNIRIEEIDDPGPVAETLRALLPQQ